MCRAQVSAPSWPMLLLGGSSLTRVEIHAIVLAPPIALGVLLAQAVEHVGGVEARVVAQLAGDDLQRPREAVHEELRLARDGPGCVPQLPAHAQVWFSMHCWMPLLHKAVPCRGLLGSRA